MLFRSKPDEGSKTFAFADFASPKSAADCVLAATIKAADCQLFVKYGFRKEGVMPGTGSVGADCQTGTEGTQSNNEGPCGHDRPKPETADDASPHSVQAEISPRPSTPLVEMVSLGGTPDFKAGAARTPPSFPLPQRLLLTDSPKAVDGRQIMPHSLTSLKEPTAEESTASVAPPDLH